MVDRRRFLDFMRQTGLAAPAPAPPPIQGPGFGTVGSSPSVPHGRPLSRPGPPPPRFTPQQAVDQLQNAAPASFVTPEMARLIADPELVRQVAPPLGPATRFEPSLPPYPSSFPDRPSVIAPNLPNVMAWQQWTETWRAENARREQAGLPPIDPQGQEFQAGQWALMTPELRAAVYDQVQEATPARSEFIEGGWAHGIPSWIQSGIETAVQNPVTETAYEDVIRPVGKPILKALATPGEMTDRYYADAAYYMATHEGEKPDALRATDFIQDSLNKSPLGKVSGPITDAISENLLLTDFLDAHPEYLVIVKQVYDDAEANGQDGSDAVVAWWSAQQGAGKALLRTALYDPLNLLGGVGAVGRVTKVAAKTREAEKGVSTTTRVLRGTGTVLEAPDVLLNQPGRIVGAVARPVASAVGSIPGVKQLREYLTSPSAQQEFSDLVRTAEEGVQTGIDEIIRAADEIKARTAAQERATARATRFADDQPGTVRVPGRKLSPEDLEAQRAAQERANAVRSSTEPATTAPQPRVGSPKGVDPTGSTSPANEIFDDALDVEAPLPSRIQAAFDSNRDILANPGRTEREIPVQDVPLDARIVATQGDLLPDQIQAYIDDPSLQSTADMPIAIKDGDTYYIIEGHHRTAAARIGGADTIQMRVIDISPSGRVGPEPLVDQPGTVNPNPTTLTSSGKKAQSDVYARSYPNANLTPYVQLLPEGASPQRIEAAVKAQLQLNRLTSAANSGSLDGLPPLSGMTDVELQLELQNIAYIPDLSDNYVLLKSQRRTAVEAEIARRANEATAPLTPEIVPNGDAAARKPDMSAFPTTAPLRDPVERQGFSLNADPTRVGTATERVIDRIAATDPQAWEKIASDPSFSQYARMEYEPNRNRLRTASVDSGDIVGAEPLPENYSARKSAVESGRKDTGIGIYEGMNKALSAAFDGDYFGRLRFYAHANGIPLDRINWRVDPVLERKIVDRKLVEMGKRPDQTFKDQTRESLVTAYIHADDADAEYIMDALENAGVVRRAAPDPGNDAQQRAFDRFAIISSARERARLTPEQMDAMLIQAGVEPTPPIIPQDDLARLEAMRDAPSTAAVTEQIIQLDPAIRSAVVKEVADWADVNLADYAVKTTMGKTWADLEYTATARKAALRQGADIQIPPPDYTADDTIDNMMRAIALEPDEAITAPLRKELYEVEYLSRDAPPLDLERTNPALFISQGMAHDNYARLQDIRRNLHGNRSQVLGLEARAGTGNIEVVKNPEGKGWIVVEADGTVQGGTAWPTKADAQKWAKRLTDEDAAKAARQETETVAETVGPTSPNGKPTPDDVKRSEKTFTEATGRPIRPASLGQMSGDRLVADALERGAFDAATAEYLSRMVTLKSGREVSIMDLVLEKMVQHDDLITAHRAAASDIADAIRAVKKSATDTIVAQSDIKMAELNKMLRANRYYLNLVREGYLLSPARIISAGSLDAIGNAWFQIISGHSGTALNTLNPLAWLGFAKHTMKGSEITHPLFDMAKQTGMKVDSSIVNVVTRDLFDPGVDTTWSDLFSKKLHMGKVGDKLSSVVAPKWGKAMRHGIDQNARAGVAADTARRALPDARNDFLLDIRRTQGDAAANALVPKLSRSGLFSPDDVLKYTNDPKLARAWRQKLSEVSDKMTAEVNRVHFEFKMTRADEIARNVMLFHFWQSRAMVFYAKTVLSNPYLLNLHVKTYEALADEAERQDVGNPMNLFLKYMAGDGGLYGYLDPLSWVIPYTMYRDAGVEYNGEKGFDKWNRRFGVFLNPMISGAATAIGVSEEFPAVLPTTAIQNLVKSVVDWDKNHGDVLGRGPGISSDPVTYFQRRVIDLINNGLHKAFPELVSDVEMPPLNTSDTRQVKALIVEQAEAEFGPYDQMTPEQRNEVGAALAAVESGSTSNERANEAYKQWSEGQLVEAGMRGVIPGQSGVKSEYRDANKKLLESAYSKEPSQRTPEEQNAVAVSETSAAGSPEATTLEIERDNLADLGTERQRALYEGWNAIAYDTLPSWAVEEIGGQTWYGYQVNDLSEAERRKLADLWALEQMESPVDPNPNDGKKPKNELEQYRDEREAYTEGSDELGGYYDYRDRVEEFPGGAAGWREYAAKESDEFAQEMERQRKLFVDRGYVPSVVERRLDQWSTSPDGYNAARGVRNKMGDAEPKDAPAEIPLSNAETEAMITDAVAKGVKEAQGGSGFNEEYGRPQFQVDILNDWQTYDGVIQQFEAQHGPISNFQSRQGEAAVAKYLADNGITEISSGLKKYLKWRTERIAAGLDFSIEAYFDEMDAAYKEKKAKEEAARGIPKSE